ncbi:hypothetical protein COOONC_12598 [Cooperia oncophora]
MRLCQQWMYLERCSSVSNTCSKCQDVLKITIFLHFMDSLRYPQYSNSSCPFRYYSLIQHIDGILFCFMNDSNQCGYNIQSSRIKPYQRLSTSSALKLQMLANKRILRISRGFGIFGCRF